MSEFTGRLKAKRGAASPSSSNRYHWKNRKSSRSRREGAGRDRDPKRYKNYRGRAPRDSEDTKNARKKDGELNKDPKEGEN